MRLALVQQRAVCLTPHPNLAHAAAAVPSMATMLNQTQPPASQTPTPVVITLANPWAGIES